MTEINAIGAAKARANPAGVQCRRETGFVSYFACLDTNLTLNWRVYLFCAKYMSKGIYLMALFIRDAERMR